MKAPDAVVIHHFKDGTADPTAQTVPAAIVNRLERILANALKKKEGEKRV